MQLNNNPKHGTFKQALAKSNALRISVLAASLLLAPAFGAIPPCFGQQIQTAKRTEAVKFSFGGKANAAVQGEDEKYENKICDYLQRTYNWKRPGSEVLAKSIANSNEFSRDMLWDKVKDALKEISRISRASGEETDVIGVFKQNNPWGRALCRRLIKYPDFLVKITKTTGRWAEEALLALAPDAMNGMLAKDQAKLLDAFSKISRNHWAGDAFRELGKGQTTERFAQDPAAFADLAQSLDNIAIDGAFRALSQEQIYVLYKKDRRKVIDVFAELVNSVLRGQSDVLYAVAEASGAFAKHSNTFVEIAHIMRTRLREMKSFSDVPEYVNALPRAFRALADERVEEQLDRNPARFVEIARTAPVDKVADAFRAQAER